MGVSCHMFQSCMEQMEASDVSPVNSASFAPLHACPDFFLLIITGN